MLADFAMRTPVVLCFGYLGLQGVQGVARMLGILSRLEGGIVANLGNVPPVILANFASSALSSSYLLILAVCTAVRLRPIAAAPGVQPRLVALLGTFATMALALFPPVSLPVWGAMLSAGLIAGGYVIATLALLHLGRSFSIAPEARRLVVSGPYRIVRHPLYLAEGVATIGLFLQHAAIPALFVLVLQLLLQLRRMGFEEGVLRDAFPAYRAYSAQTPRLIPGLY